MADKKKEPFICDANETGVCGMHNIEVERRKNSVDGVRSYVKNSFVIIMLVMVASFTYTTINKQAADSADQELRASVKELATTVSELGHMIAHDRGAMGPLVEQLKTLNNHLEGKFRTIPQLSTGRDNGIH